MLAQQDFYGGTRPQKSKRGQIMSASFPIRLRIPTDARDLSRDAGKPTASLPTHSEDARLMVEVQEGNHESLAGLFDRYSRMVFQISCQVLRDD